MKQLNRGPLWCEVNILKIISEEADKLFEKYSEENEIHEGYYQAGVRRFEEILKSKLEKMVFVI